MEIRSIDLRDRLVYLGKRGENRARMIRFDIGAWRELYGGEGSAVLLHWRCGDEHPYPATAEINGDAVEWVITNADNAKPGGGRAELQYVVGDTVVKSKTYDTIVDDCLGEGTEEVPDAYQSWVDTVAKTGAQAVNDAKKADASRAAAEASESRTKQYEDSAADSSTASVRAAVEAMESRRAAELFAQKAEQAAKDASAGVAGAKTSAEQAEASRSAAERSKDSAEDSENKARQYAESARKDREAAVSSASNAKSYSASAAVSEKNAKASADAAKEASGRYPYIDSATKMWMVWDASAGKYVSTGIKAEGSSSGGGGGSGEPGYSPSAKVEQTSTGAKITITDIDGTTTATVTNGKDGKDGKDGDDYVLTQADKEEIAGMIEGGGGSGEPGYSPSAKVEQTSTGAKITITDIDGTTTATVTNGKDGKSAYQYAADAGYTGTETDFSGSLAKVQNLYDKNEVDAALGAYITDVNNLIGGD